MALEERIVKKHLYEWLLDHNALTIPQLGRFEATPTSATIQPGVYKFLPPNKKVTFHTEHEATDVQLRDLLMEREQLNAEQANYTISVFVQKVQESLAKRQRYELEGFGLLSQLNENTVIFRIDEEANVEGDSYGLPGLYPKPLVHSPENTMVGGTLSKTNPDLPPYTEEGEEEEGDVFVPLTNPKDLKSNTTASKEPANEDITIEEKRVNRSSNTLLVYSLTMLFLVALVFLLFLITDPFWSGTVDASADKNKHIPKKEDVKKDNKEEKQEPEKKEEKAEKAEDIEKTPPKSITPNITYATNGNYVAGFAWIPQAPPNLAQVLNKTRSNKSYVILGSFDKAENAYSFYNNLAKRGISTACMVAPVAGNTRYRVCLGKFDTVDEATKEGLAFGKINSIGFFILTY
ncbi:MAG: SPOR domain-containing protein [Bacteroidetes bacterium]|nr:MAG: SPOR domain-containing protein [Bacteroidota bacterium]